jgi:tetratricopeptide (TPR) repeat protein
MLLTFLILLFNLNSLTDISTLNRHIALAEKARKKGDYLEALQAYQMLFHHLKHQTPEVTLNYAHCHFELKQSDSALYYYSKLNQAPAPIKTLALQQKGTIEAQQNKIEQALESYKEALRTDPSNEQARYNYENLKKQKQQQDQQKDKGQDQQKDKNNQENQNKENHQKNEKSDSQNKPSNPDKNPKDQPSPDPQNGDSENQNNAQKLKKERFEQIHMTQEQAQQIMNALKSSELQYFQNAKKKPITKPDKSKPDW